MSCDVATGGVFDGRRLDEATAEPTMLDCVERLRTGKFDGVAAWLMDELMARGWGCTPAVQAAIDGFQSEKVDSLFLRAMQLCYDENEEEAFHMCSEGVKLSDPSGRCHSWLGEYHQEGWGITEQNLEKAIQMYHAGVALGDPRAQWKLAFRYQHGMDVEDIDEARRLSTLSHHQGYASATYNLGWMSDDNIPLSVALFKEASARGHEGATYELQKMQRKDQSCVVPFGCWSPQHHVHMWVSDSMHREMMCLLMARRRPDGLVNTLPKLVMHRICFYVACRPEKYIPPSAEAVLLAKLDRRGWKMERTLCSMQLEIESLGDRVDRSTLVAIAQNKRNESTLALLQQQVSSILKLLTNQDQSQIDDRHPKRQKQ